MVEAVYELEPELLETDHLAAFSYALARFRRRTTLVICTDLTEATVTETLLPLLPLVLRDHLVIILAVTDPEVAAWAGEPVADDEGLYRRAAASGALEDRAHGWQRLRWRRRGRSSTRRRGSWPAAWSTPTSPPVGEAGCDAPSRGAG